MSWKQYLQCPSNSSPITTFLYERETESGMALADYESLQSGRVNFHTHGLFAFEIDGEVHGVSLYQKEGKELLATSMPTYAVEPLVDQLSKRGYQIDQFIGPADTCTVFEALWTDRHGVSVIQSMLQGVYEARTLRLPPVAGGHLTMATQAHVDLATRYIHEFGLACFPEQEQSRERAARAAAQLIENKRLFFWMDESKAMVSMAAKVRETCNTVGISLVYTPTRHRKRGHAARVVGYLSQTVLDAGKAACTLYTDLSNPTSNGVYLGLGYRQVAEQRIVRFTQPE